MQRLRLTSLVLAGIAMLMPGITSAQGPLPVTRSTMVPFEVSPFPYRGIAPRTGKPFLDVEEGVRRGRTARRGGVLWEHTTYSDRRVLMAIPRGFDIRRPALIVVFFHGNGATLARDVRNRQQVPRQIVESGSMPCWWRRSLRSTPPIPAPAGSGSRACSRSS